MSTYCFYFCLTMVFETLKMYAEYKSGEMAAFYFYHRRGVKTIIYYKLKFSDILNFGQVFFKVEQNITSMIIILEIIHSGFVRKLNVRN